MEVRAGDQTLVFDCGTGIRALGTHLLETHPGPLTVNLFISHAHWDHIQGFPFFAPLFVPGTQVNVFGPQEQHQRLSDTMAGQMQYRYFPVDIAQLSATIEYQELREQRIGLGEVQVASHYLNHTTLAMAYRVQLGGCSVVYATDTEPFAQRPRAWVNDKSRRFYHRRDEELAEFLADADVLVLDSQYRSDEYAAKIGWGHSTFDYALDLAISAGIKRLVFYHHDPTRSDKELAKTVQACQARVQAEAPDMQVEAAAEGMTIDLPDRAAPRLELRPYPLPAFLHQVHVALMGVDQTTETLASQALSQAHFKLRCFDRADAARSRELRDFRPDIVVLQPGEPGQIADLKRYLAKGARHAVPLLALLASDADGSIEQAFDEGVSDVVSLPFTHSQLRSRVDAWLFRGGVAVDRRVHLRKRREFVTRASA